MCRGKHCLKYVEALRKEKKETNETGAYRCKKDPGAQASVQTNVGNESFMLDGLGCLSNS